MEEIHVKCFQFPQLINFSSVKKLMQTVKINKVSYTTQPQPTLCFKVSLTFMEGLCTTFLEMATIAQTTKLRVIRKRVALGLYRMEVVKFTDDTYQSLSDDTVLMSCSDTNGVH